MKSYLMGAAVATALVVSAGGAQAAVETKSLTSVSPVVSTISASRTSETYTTVLHLLAGNTYSYLVNWAKSTGAGDVSGWSLFSTGVVSAGALSLSPSSASKDGTFSVNTSGDYTFLLSTTTSGANPNVLGNFTKAQVTGTFAAVPGPIAGAGLPVLLGFAGFAALRRRASRAA